MFRKTDNTPRHNLLRYNHGLLREVFLKALKVDRAKSTCFLVTERQSYYMPVKGGVGLRNLQPQDFEWFSNYLSITQSNVALEGKISTKAYMKFPPFGLAHTWICIHYNNIHVWGT